MNGMEPRDIFANISPLDHRYSISDPQLYAGLQRCLSEDAAVRACLRVEIALLKTLISRQDNSIKAGLSFAELDSLAVSISPHEIYAEEEKTRHNIRALVNVLKKHVPQAAKPFVHLGATSVDILDTAASMRYRDVVESVIMPLLLDLEAELARLSRNEAETTQIGRTHGQHAVPITFGFAVAQYVSRLGQSLIRITERASDLRGKLSGAVGSYNATSLIVADPLSLEKDFLSGLGLKPSELSTQLVQPEYLLALLLELNTAFGIIANLADDLRNLQRSEIGEVREEFASTQVGSSTMPQKRNPWNSEHVKSLWKAFCPRVVTFFMDQISEHQRDLTNSASSRFIADYIAGFASAASRMLSVVRSLSVNRARMAENLAMGGDLVFSEPVYVLIARGGESDAHESVRKATMRAEKTGEKLRDVLREDKRLWKLLDDNLKSALGVKADDFFSDPASYTGLAARKARETADAYDAVIGKLRREHAHG
jgi:adenylosuccinate lyase